jgi:hypothetical protein
MKSWRSRPIGRSGIWRIAPPGPQVPNEYLAGKGKGKSWETRDDFEKRKAKAGIGL